MGKFIKRHALMFFAVLVLWEMLVILIALSLLYTQGHWIYSLDDTYIHMAIAKNLALHGVYGVTPYAFTAAASSILWPPLLAGIYAIFGLSEIVPLILNVIFATGTVILAYAILLRYRKPDRFTMLVLLALIFGIPMLALIASGLEHSAHILVTLAFVFLAAEILASDSGSSRRARIALLALAPLVSGFRYEGLFPLVIVCLLFLLRRRFGYAILIGGLGALPVLVFGLISVGQGWFFLPAPVLVKGVLPNLASLPSTMNVIGLQRFFQQPHMMVLVFAALFLLILGRRSPWWSPSVIALIVFVPTALLHVQLVDPGTRFDNGARYDGYVVALGLVAIAAAISELTRSGLAVKLNPRFMALAGLAVLLAAPLVNRGVVATYMYFKGTANIYEQQYQMALFVHDFYQDQSVIMNDIGAINYLSDVRCVDLVGLGNLEVARIRAAQVREINMAEIDTLARETDARIAIVYASSAIPDHWLTVGQWTIPDNIIAGGATVTFYAVQPAEADRLIANLRAFAPRLPSSVTQAGLYMQAAHQ